MFDGVSELAEYQGGTLVSDSVVTAPPDGRVQFAATNEEYVLFRDLVGSIRLVTKSSANVVGRGEFDPYGVELAGNVNLPSLRFRFMGREQDESIRLYHFRARHYNPSNGRFEQRDPVDAQNSQSVYQAFASNPIVFVDSFGTSKVGGKICSKTNFST